MSKPILQTIGVVAAAAIIAVTTHIVGSGPDYSKWEPNPALSPGVVDARLTQDVLAAPGFTTKNYRNVPEEEKKAVFTEYGITNPTPGAYEIDHIISLEVGGSNDIKNLWPQPYQGEWNAHDKDKLEDELGREVKSRKIELSVAQTMLSKDWVASYLKIFGSKAK